MLSFSVYVLKVIICSGVLLGYYWLLLRNKVFHGYNRFYLLVAVALSILAPLIKINMWHSGSAGTQSIKVLQAVAGSSEYLDDVIITAKQNSFGFDAAITAFYLLVCVVLLAGFMQTLLTIRTLLLRHKQTIVNNICFVNTRAKGTPFSFLKYIFWNDDIDISTSSGNQVFKHELAHVQQKHSYDKLFINAILVVFWCNPFFWLLRREMEMIHEFIADKTAVENSDTEAFAAMILQAAYPKHRFAITNHFFYSPIKRRLIMLTKNNKTKAGYIARIMLLPLAFLLFAAFTLKTKTFNSYTVPEYTGKKITVVIDAGHGGKDNGAVSLDGNTTEKDIALSVAAKIKALNTNADINILLTRENDIYQSPPQKNDFSEAQHADLFISIHADAAGKDSAAIKSGMSVWVARDAYANSNNSKLFASAIINEFKNNYQLPVASLPQQRQKGIWVVQQSTCPAIIIEAGYLTNKKDLAYLQTDEGKETVAKNILAAIEKYAIAANHSTNIETTNIDHSFSQNDTVPKPKNSDGHVQIKADKVKAKQLASDGQLLIINERKATRAEMNKLSSDNIKSIDVYKANNTEAMKLYGPDAKKGVIKITTGDTHFITNEEKKTVANTGMVFTKVENEPSFPGGDSAWRRYLETHLNASTPVDSGAPSGQYRILVKFVVNKDGSIQDITAETKHGYGMEQAAVKLIEKGPRWLPAVQNGHTVAAYRKQQITFVIQDQ